MFLGNVVYGLRRGRASGPNPWGGATLEWSVASPPPPYNFVVLPHVASRHPLWEEALDEGAPSRLDAGYLLDAGRETLGVTPLDGHPDVILKMPGDSWLPLLLSALLFVLFGALLVGVGVLAWVAAAALLVVLARWFWPQPDTVADERVRTYE
jgi:cytochrome c oxidase subunit 1/cytochrome c oxidase subunit I+III